MKGFSSVNENKHKILPQCLPKKKCKEVCTTNTSWASMSNDLRSIIDIHKVTKNLYSYTYVCRYVKCVC